MKIRYLFDENLSPRFLETLKYHYPQIDALKVGDEGAPPYSSSDPFILRYLEQSQRVLVTDNRKSMPRHIIDHFAEGHYHWGIFTISKHDRFIIVAEALAIYWEASEAEDWINKMEWVTL